MTIYLLTYIFLSFLTAFANNLKFKNFYLFLLFSLLFIIGLRYEIGGDWVPYLNYYEIIYPYWENIFFTDPGYGIINFISGWLNGGIYLVNTLSGFIFLFGLLYFINHLPYPSLALAIANSYLVFVVAMGYTRQSIAIGLLMIAYILFSKGKIFRSFIFSFLSVFFHITAFIGVSIILLAYIWQKRFRIITNIKYLLILIILIILFLYSFYSFFLPDMDHFINHYVKAKMESKGAYPRVILNSIAGLIVLLGIVKIPTSGHTLWKILSMISFLSSFAIPFLGSTTVDRINLYLYPLQMVSFTYLFIRIKDNNLKYLFWFFIFSLYFFILVIWLLFAVNKEYWVPYKNLIFELIIGA